MPIVFVDANVLYSKTLRDWLFLLRIETCGDLFTVASSNDAITEALYWLRKKNPDAPGYFISNTKEIIEASLDDRIRDFPAGVTFPGDDKHDTHVHAAAAACGATYLITGDEGFRAVEDELPYEVHTADSFFQLVAENVPQAVDDVIRRQRAYSRSRGWTKTLSEMLRAAQCPTFAEIVDRHLRALSDGHTTSGIAATVEPRRAAGADADTPALEDAGVTSGDGAAF